jgi:hypothetical protein
MMIVWLVTIFASFGYQAPRNRVVAAVVCAGGFAHLGSAIPHSGHGRADLRAGQDLKTLHSSGPCSSSSAEGLLALARRCWASLGRGEAGEVRAVPRGRSLNPTLRGSGRARRAVTGVTASSR